MSTLSLDPYWTLEDALPLIRGIQPHTRSYGYHLALGGGVLNNGKSGKDLDLYFLPLESQKFKTDCDGMLSFLKDTWGTCEEIGPPRPEKKERDPRVLVHDEAPPLPPAGAAQFIIVNGERQHIGRNQFVQWAAAGGEGAQAVVEWRNAPDHRGRMEIVQDKIPDYPEPAEDSRYAHRVKFNWSGLRIDVFIME